MIAEIKKPIHWMCSDDLCFEDKEEAIKHEHRLAHNALVKALPRESSLIGRFSEIMSHANEIREYLDHIDSIYDK